MHADLTKHGRVVGGFTRSSQHFDVRGGDGSAGWVDEGVDGPLGDQSTGQAVAEVRRRGFPRRLWVDSSMTGELLCLRENRSRDSYTATLGDEEVWSIVAADDDADDAAVFFFERGTTVTEEQADWLLPLLVWLTWRATIANAASNAPSFSLLDLILPS